MTEEAIHAKPRSREGDAGAAATVDREDVARIVVDRFKSVETLAKVHGKQLLTYLRLTDQPLGLLIYFGAATFRDGIRRVVNNHTHFAASRLRVNQPSAKVEGW